MRREYYCTLAIISLGISAAHGQIPMDLWMGKFQEEEAVILSTDYGVFVEGSPIDVEDVTGFSPTLVVRWYTSESLSSVLVFYESRTFVDLVKTLEREWGAPYFSVRRVDDSRGQSSYGDEAEVARRRYWWKVGLAEGWPPSVVRLSNRARAELVPDPEALGLEAGRSYSLLQITAVQEH